MSVLDRLLAEPDLLEYATDDERAALTEWLEAKLYDWTLQARPDQLPPVGEWLVWLILAGRGWGKTRTGAEWAKDKAKLPDQRIALVGATLDDVRDTMVEGESGLLSVLPHTLLRGGSRDTAWNRSLGELYLANGTKFKGYSAERPDKLRGPQHHAAWCDEPMSWKDAGHGPDAEDTTWSNLMLGLRLGDNPQCVVTGTPKPRRLLIGAKGKPGIMAQPGTQVTTGSTYDNLENLAPTFKAQILAKYEGTRTGRQELLAEILTDIEGALWSLLAIDDRRCSPDVVGDLSRIVVAVDPAVTSGDESDETGIIAAGVCDPGWCPVCGVLQDGVRHGFILADESCRVSPDQWCRRAVDLHDRVAGDCIVAEVNNGGDLVETVLRTVDVGVPYRKVTASRGKRTRAEPIAALYEQGRVHHVGTFSELEDQMCSWTPDSGESPDRMDALVWCLTDLLVEPPKRRRELRAA